MIDYTEILRQVRVALQADDYPAAIHGLEQAAQLAAESGDRAAEGRHLGNLALLYYRTGAVERALAYFEQALANARAEDDRVTEDGLLGNIGNIMRELGRYDDAIAYLNQALLIAQEIGDARGRGIWLGNLALVYDDLRMPEQAATLHEQSVHVARQLHDQRGLALRLVNLGHSYLALGNDLRALGAFEDAALIYRELGDRAGLFGCLSLVGSLHNGLAQRATTRAALMTHGQAAINGHRQALELALEFGDDGESAALLLALGEISTLLGDVTNAVAYLESSARYYAVIGADDQASILGEMIAGLRASQEPDAG
ncbi:MAG: tetratricopeptide repeat protein [Chloroflexi bacterium]|nr:tetratricopeptide repeat protein [Chloroflexota bacterium]